MKKLLILLFVSNIIMNIQAEEIFDLKNSIRSAIAQLQENRFNAAQKQQIYDQAIQKANILASKQIAVKQMRLELDTAYQKAMQNVPAAMKQRITAGQAFAPQRQEGIAEAQTIPSQALTPEQAQLKKRGQLMDQIKEGSSLKPAGQRPLPPLPKSPSEQLLNQVKQCPALKPAQERVLAPRPVDQTPHGSLMESIKQGTTLKKVQPAESKQFQHELQKPIEGALEQRRQAIEAQKPKGSPLGFEQEWD